MEKGGQYSIHEIDLTECPRSAVKPEAMELVQIFSQAKQAGVPLYGQDLSKWPARMVDAAVVIEQETIREYNARFIAEHENDNDFTQD